MTVATTPLALPHALPSEPSGDVNRRNLEEELEGLQEQVSQHKAKVRSRGLPHCPPATTHATFPSGDISETVLVLIPPKGYEGERTMTKDNHNLIKPDLISKGTGEQVKQVLEDHAAMVPVTHDLAPVPHPFINEVSEDQAAMEAHLLKDLIELGAEDNAPTTGYHNFYKEATSPHHPREYTGDWAQIQQHVRLQDRHL